MVCRIVVVTISIILTSINGSISIVMISSALAIGIASSSNSSSSSCMTVPLLIQGVGGERQTQHECHSLAQDKGGPSKGGILNNRLCS